MRDFGRQSGILRTLGACVSILAILTVSACSGSSPTASVDDAGARAAYLALLDSAIENAIEDGASQAQIDLLESTRSDGYLSFSMAHTALMNYASCLADHGIEFQELSPSGPSEFPMYGGLTGVSDASEQEWMDRCAVMEFGEANDLYQTQPRFVQARKDLISVNREVLLDCLETAGRPLPDDATVDEITHELYFALYGAYVDTPGPLPSNYPSVDCLSPTGIDWNDLIFDTHSPDFG